MRALKKDPYPLNDKINVTKELKYVLGREKIILGKGGNTGFQHCLLFQQCFGKAFSVVKSGYCVVIAFNLFPNDKF